MTRERPTAISGRGRTRLWLAGMVAAGLALGVAELAAGIVMRVPSLVVAVGDVVVATVPPAVEDAAIAVFGTSDKAALLAGIVVLATVFGGLLGLLAGRRFWVAAGGFAVFGLLGVAAAARQQQASVGLAAAGAAVGVLAGVVALRRLVKIHTSVTESGSRRVFLKAAAGVAVLAAGSAALGRTLALRSRVALLREQVSLPTPSQTVVAPPGADVAVAGASSYVTPNDNFYRIDTALTVPRVDPASWRLRFVGMLDRPFELSYDDLLALPHVEAAVTLACVSNEVGGHLVGNALWQGVPLAELLERAGVQNGATQVVGRSVDGWTAGFPTDLALDGRDALVAVAMNGEPLPLAHGFPARLVVPGLYGYVSATKWVTEVELTTLEAFDAYWVPRGWAKEAPIKTQSRIDVPRFGASVPLGPVDIAGVAWAPTRGISKVEVQVDDGEWREAGLAEVAGPDTWRLWHMPWDATPGRHRLAVRATDGAGVTQTAERSPPRPDGATGYHTIRVDVVAGGTPAPEDDPNRKDGR